MNDFSQHAIHNPVNPPVYNHCLNRRISWSAIIVGALVAMGLGFLLNLFSFAIGLSVFSSNSEGAEVLAVGGAVGILVGIIASMLAAGYAAGYLGRSYCPRRNLGILYGFTTWCLALLLSALLAAHSNSYLVNYTANISNAHIVTAEGNNANQTPNVAIKNSNTNNQINISSQSMAWTAFTVFVLFFVGAVSTCVGAYCGMSCRTED